MKPILILVLGLLIVGCTPYTQQIHNLDKAYQTGQIPPAQYFAEKQQLLMAQQQWGNNFAANLQQGMAQQQQQTAPQVVVVQQQQPYYQNGPVPVINPNQYQSPTMSGAIR